MSDEEKVKILKSILSRQIEWYKENEDDMSRVYDELYERFDDLTRGQFVEIIEVLLGDKS